MARPLRIEYEGAFYHVTSRGNTKQNIFFGNEDYDRLKKYIETAKKKYSIKIHCYVFMTNHYHLIMETEKANLSRVMHYINGSYTNYINIKRKRSGHLFQGRYKSIVIDADSYLLELSRYIHLNPVRAKIVEKPEDYLYSSYKSYISKNKDIVVSNDYVLEMINKNDKYAKGRYKYFVEEGIDEKIENPFRDIYGGIIIGKERFIKNVLKRVKDEKWQVDDVSYRKELRALELDEILEIISKYFKMSKEEIFISREKRKIAICLIKENTEITNRQIGKVFGGISYSAVSKMYERYKNDVRKNKKIRKQIEQIKRKLSNVKG